jgi:nicotinamide N-methyltransferase
MNIASLPSSVPKNIVAEPYLWGNPLPEVLSHLPPPAEAFDLVILSDLLFNHSEHAKLLKTVLLTLKKENEARALVFFTPHRPWLLEKDLEFLKVAGEAGLRVERTVETLLERPMFEEDKGVG